MLRDTVIGAIRTGVAAAVAVALTWLFNFGVEVPEDFAESLNLVLFGLVTAGYNLGVGLLERKVHPYFGVLLGVPKAPAYGSVGTQTPPPHKEGVANDRGSVSLLALGAVVALVGFLVWALTLQDVFGLVLVAIGVVVAIVGALNGNRRV